MIVRFYRQYDVKLLAEYSSFVSMQEINSTVDLLEYENKCKVKAKIIINDNVVNNLYKSNNIEIKL